MPSVAPIVAAPIIGGGNGKRESAAKPYTAVRRGLPEVDLVARLGAMQEGREPAESVSAMKARVGISVPTGDPSTQMRQGKSSRY